MNDNVIQFKKDIDYLIHNRIIEFNKDYFEAGIIKPDQSFYGEITDIIDESLYTSYGSLINIPDYTKYNFNNTSGKAAVNAILYSLQNSSYIDLYQKALNVYYGLPVAPQNCKVIGLYESYDYTITDINGDTIILNLKPGSFLHKFIQPQTKLFVNRTNKEITVSSIVDRSLGQITIETPANIKIGDKLNIKLTNKYPLKSVTEETETDNAIFTVETKEPAEKLNHLIDIIQKMTNYNEYPELLLWGTEKFYHNYNGIYHMIEVLDTI